MELALIPDYKMGFIGSKHLIFEIHVFSYCSHGEGRTLSAIKLKIFDSQSALCF